MVPASLLFRGEHSTPHGAGGQASGEVPSSWREGSRRELGLRGTGNPGGDPIREGGTEKGAPPPPTPLPICAQNL